MYVKQQVAIPSELYYRLSHWGFDMSYYTPIKYLPLYGV